MVNSDFVLVKSDFLNKGAASIYSIANNDFMFPLNFSVIPYETM